MWSTNMPFNWEGRWSYGRRDKRRAGDCGKQSISGDHDPPFSVAPIGRRGLGLEPTRLKQKSPLLPQRDTQTDHFTGASCIGFLGGILFIHFIIIVVFVFCCFFDSFGNGSTSTLAWNPKCEEISVARLDIYSEINTAKGSGSHLWSNHHVKANFSVVIWRIPLGEIF